MAWNRWIRTALALAVAGAVTALPGRVRPTVDVLQMNLCDSGWASCYTGRSVARAAAVIRDRRPDVVTLNEVCRGDVDTLSRAFAPGPASAWFTPAMRRGTGRPIACRDGEPYGIAILARAGAVAAAVVSRDGIYPTQAAGTVEDRAWLCATGAVAVCTTHLASADPAVARAQCRYLFTTVVAAVPGPVVVGGDFNLADLSECLPAGYTVDSDGGDQFVVSRTGDPGTVTLVGMHRTTDHPGLLVRVAGDWTS